jgi:two-component system chemotaxis response regulator CheY
MALPLLDPHPGHRVAESLGRKATARRGKRRFKEVTVDRTVLIVDDALFMRKMLRDIVENGGYRVVGEAENGREAIELARERRPDVVLLDIVMPDLGGIDSLRRIMEVAPDSTIVMCSAMGQKVLIQEALEIGAADFIIKPFQPDEVLDVLESATTARSRQT